MSVQYLDKSGLTYFWGKIKAYVSAHCGDGLTINDIYPVGSIYMSVNAVDPATLFSGTTWVQIKDRFLLAAGDTYSNTSTGGAATVTLTAAQSGVPAHKHSVGAHQHPANGSTYFVTNDNANAANGGFTTASGGRWTDGQTASGTFHHYENTGASTAFDSGNNTAANASAAHENMPPYLTVNIWKRTA